MIVVATAPAPLALVECSAKEKDLPTREEFVRTIWDETIDSWARASWIDAFITAAKSRPDGSFADAGHALAKLIASGVERNDIGAVARAVAYEVTFSLLYMLDDPGVDDGNVFMLHESLLVTVHRMLEMSPKLAIVRQYYSANSTSFKRKSLLIAGVMVHSG